MIPFTCPHCNQSQNVKDGLVGQMIKCPKCGQTIHVSEPVLTGSTLSKIEPVPSDPPNQNVTEHETVAPALKAEFGSQIETKSPHPLDASADKITYDFLAPPLGPDEIGRLGSYRVLKPLGQGGMGVVFLAEDTQLERTVALKAMKPALAASDSAKKRFLREAKTAARMKHDHIVTIYQVGEDRGVPFLAMEFLEGESLEDRSKRERQLPIAEILRIGREIAEGLAAAHEKGLIHRDIKPANVWLEGKKGRVKILDFGLARAADDDVHLTQSGAIIGTPAYMAPEQARCEKVDYRCDLFSLGCVLYRLCTAKLPFKGNDTISMLMAVATEIPKTPNELNPDVPLELSQVVMSLLAKEKTERPASALEVAAHLQEIERSTQTHTYANPPNQQIHSVFSPKEKRDDTVAAEPSHSFLEKPTKRRWPMVVSLTLIVLIVTLFLRHEAGLALLLSVGLCLWLVYRRPKAWSMIRAAGARYFFPMFGTTTGWAIALCFLGVATAIQPVFPVAELQVLNASGFGDQKGETSMPRRNDSGLGVPIATVFGYESSAMATAGIFLALFLVLVATSFIEPTPLWRSVLILFAGVGVVWAMGGSIRDSGRGGSASEGPLSGTYSFNVLWKEVHVAYTLPQHFGTAEFQTAGKTTRVSLQNRKERPPQISRVVLQFAGYSILFLGFCLVLLGTGQVRGVMMRRHVGG